MWFSEQRDTSYQLTKIIDIYDQESYVRRYVLDNIFVCIFMYILFYFTISYAHKVIERIEQKNEEMRETVERNRLKLNDIIALKDKREEYEEIIIKAKNEQRIKSNELDGKIKRINSKVELTIAKLNELEKFLSKWKLWKNCTERSSKNNNSLLKWETSDERINGNLHEDVKILEPSFPPSTPPEPPPRKFGVFARPPVLHAPSSKMGFK